MSRLFSRSDALWLGFFIFFFVALLHFQYPLMWSYQAEEGNDGKFALTTARGDIGFTNDVGAYGSDIISVCSSPGLFLKDPFSFEHRDEIVPMQGSLPFLMHAGLYAFSGDITATLILGSVISVALIVTLLYAVSKVIQRRCGMAGGNFNALFLIMSFFTLPYVIFELINLFLGNSTLMRPYIGYIGRFININHIVIFLLLWFLLLCIIVLFNRWNARLLVLLGVSLAALQYSYFYFYTSALLFTAIVIVLASGWEVKTLWRLCWTYLTWLVLSLPYLASFIIFRDFNSGVLMRVGAQFSGFHSFTVHISFLVLFSAACIMVNFYYLKSRGHAPVLELLRESSFVIALAASGIILLNIQLLLGYTVQPYHWVVAFLQPVGIIIAFDHIIKLFCALEMSRRRIVLNLLGVMKIGMLLFIIALGFGAVSHLAASAWQWKGFLYHGENEEGLLDFIRGTDKDSVFFADKSYTNDLVRVNTERYTLLGHTVHSRMTINETHERLLFGYRKLNLSMEVLEEDIVGSSGYFNYLEKARSFQLPDDFENFNNVFNYYHLYYSNTTMHDSGRLIEELSKTDSNKTFKLDYLIYTNPPDWVLSFQGVVYRNGRYAVRKV